MTATFLPTVLQGPDWTYLRLAGVIDESNPLEPLLERISGQYLLLDLAQIERINSCGVRDWVIWLKQASQKASECALLDCSPAIVTQLNLVGNLVGDALVASVLAPYYCERCDREHTVRVSLLDLKLGEALSAPAANCLQCGAPSQFDDIEASYFSFFDPAQPPRLSAGLEAALTAARTKLGEPFPIPRGGRLSMAPTHTAPTHTPPTHTPPTHTPPTHTPPTDGSTDGDLEPTPSADRGDIVFFLAVGILSAILAVVIYQIAAP